VIGWIDDIQLTHGHYCIYVILADRYMSRTIKNLLVRILRGLFGNELNKVNLILLSSEALYVGGCGVMVGTHAKLDSLQVATDAISKALQPKQVAAFWKNQREVIWWPLPEGVLAPETPLRSLDCQNRTRIEARAKVFGLLPSVIKEFVGPTTARRGVTDLFEMLQSRELNRRLLYVAHNLLMVHRQIAKPIARAEAPRALILSHRRSPLIGTLSSRRPL
jgi:hypothetical protein